MPCFLLRWLLCVLSMLAMVNVQAQGTAFARPASLEPAVKFWKRVYTEVGTGGGFIHDHTRLDVVYGTMEFAPGMTGKPRSDLIDDEKAFVARTLRKLAAGVDDLSANERRVRAAWPQDASASEFRAAAERVRFQLGQADRFREGLIRSGTWRDEIRRIFKEQGLPEELAALPHVESSFNTYAYSKVGAAGMWQFMRSTGARYMRIDNVVDERLDPYKASVAAANFLQQNYAILQSWPLALTAYNHGPGGMRRAKEQLGTDDIGLIVQKYESKSFGFASRNFYASFLAALEVDSNPQKYFPGIELNPPDPSKVMPIKNFTSMPSLAKSLRIETTVLKQLNPSLRPPVWTGSKRIPSGFQLRVPGSADQLAALRELPSSAVAATQVVDQSHRVRKGETLSAIAAKYKISTQQLAALNGLRQPYRLTVGKILKLPGAAALASTVTPVAASAVNDRNVDNSNEQALYYRVRRGDTLSKIAQRYSVSQSELLALNKLRNANQVLLGQNLLIRAVGPQPANAAEPDEQEVTPTTLARAEKVEPKTESEAEALGPTLLPGVQAAVSADPADYAVSKGNTIRVEASETLGHYAEWLNTTPAKLRSLNKLSATAALPLGKPLKLDFSRASVAQFEARRLTYHQQQEAAFFADFRIAGSDSYVLKRGDSIWSLSQKANNVPLWLLRQYNPDVDLSDLRPGTKLVIPRVERIEG